MFDSKQILTNFRILSFLREEPITSLSLRASVRASMARLIGLLVNNYLTSHGLRELDNFEGHLEINNCFSVFALRHL